MYAANKETVRFLKDCFNLKQPQSVSKFRNVLKNLSVIMVKDLPQKDDFEQVYDAVRTKCLDK